MSHYKPPPDPDPATTSAAMRVHAQMVALLRRPGACAGGTGAAGLIETHLSSLLVAGEFVYKLKKPLRLGSFVDFTSLDQRHDACEQELRLNRRTAPRWYLAVLPVCQGVDGPFIAAPTDARLGPVVSLVKLTHDAPAAVGVVLDWAVQMRHFDDSGRLDRLALAGQLTPQQVDSLAATVARFHAQQSPAPPGYGRAGATRHTARENLLELAALVATPVAAPVNALVVDDHFAVASQRPGAGAPDLPTTVAALQRWTESRGAALAPLMDLRRRTGHVREVHGDLHLANIVWADGAPVLFDALEFNDNLRHIDTIGDLAFTFMDLHAHGLPRLAWRFISASLEANGDHAALPLLAWWAVYRALVRAKVALLGAAGVADAGDAANAAALTTARRYLGVAVALAGLPNGENAAENAAENAGPNSHAAQQITPMLVLTFGLSGSGKSTAAAALAERLGAVRVRSDVERKRLFALPPTARNAQITPGLYAPDATRRTYERLQELATLALQAGVSVVVDAASLHRAERDDFRALAATLGVPFHLLACEAPSAVLHARVAQRATANGDASDATTEVLASQQTWAEWPGDDEAADTLRLDTNAPLAAVLARVEALPIGLLIALPIALTIAP